MSRYIRDTIELGTNSYDILIGKNALGNEEIIKISMEKNKDSIWFHFDEVSSPHIILLASETSEKEKIYKNKNLLKKVGMLLYKYKKNIPPCTKIIYTKVKNLVLTDDVGTVIPKNYNFL